MDKFINDCHDYVIYSVIEKLQEVIGWGPRACLTFDPTGSILITPAEP